MGGVPCHRCIIAGTRTGPSTRVGRKSVAASGEVDGCSRHMTQPDGRVFHGWRHMDSVVLCWSCGAGG